MPIRLPLKFLLTTQLLCVIFIYSLRSKKETNGTISVRQNLIFQHSFLEMAIITNEDHISLTCLLKSLLKIGIIQPQFLWIYFLLIFQNMPLSIKSGNI